MKPNYKIVITPTGKNPVIDNVLQRKDNKSLTMYDHAVMEHIIENFIPVNIHIVDTNATIKENEKLIDLRPLQYGKIHEFDTYSTALGFINWIRTKAGILLKPIEQAAKIIATTDQSLGLPLLSKQSIETIIEHNGNIEEFDIKIIEEDTIVGTWADTDSPYIVPLDVIDIGLPNTTEKQI